MIEVTLDRDAFITALTAAFDAATKSNAQPVLQNVQLNVGWYGGVPLGSLFGGDGSLLKVVTLDDCGLDIKREGRCLLPPGVIRLIRSIPRDTRVIIYSDDIDLVITAATSSMQPTWRLGAPQGEIEIEETGAQIAKYELWNYDTTHALKKVLGAVGGAFVSPQLQFIQFKTDPVDGLLRIRAYGGAQYRCATYEGSTDDLDLLVPKRLAEQIVSIGDRKEAYENYFDLVNYEHVLKADLGDTVWCTKARTIYPDLDKYVLEPIDAGLPELKFDFGEMLDCLDRVKPMAGKLGYAELDVRADVIKITAVDEFQNEARDRIDADWSGDPRHVGIDINQFGDLLTSFGKEETAVRVGEDTRDRLGLIYLDSSGYTAHIEQLRSDLVRTKVPERVEVGERLCL